jgi:hypothetical protein
MMTPERLAEIRADDESLVPLGERPKNLAPWYVLDGHVDEMATMFRRAAIERRDLLAEVDRLRAQVAAVEALTGGPFSDGYLPYAMEVNGEVVLGVGLDDLRAALGEKP